MLLLFFWFFFCMLMLSQSSVEDRDWRSEEVNRKSAASLCSSNEGEEPLNCYGPMSPTFKVPVDNKNVLYIQ